MKEIKDYLFIGQHVEMNCGAMCPTTSGEILDFDNDPAMRFGAAHAVAIIRWEGCDDRPSWVERHDISRIMYRKPESGSPIGIYAKMEKYRVSR
jgi:hypothetical protein